MRTVRAGGALLVALGACILAWLMVLRAVAGQMFSSRRWHVSRASLITVLAMGLIVGMEAFSFVSFPTHAAGADVVGGLTVQFGDSTALARWSSDPLAVGGYQVTLVRASDNGIMEQFPVPATQTAADLQGIWPGESYFVAVQPVDAQGNAGAATVSAPGQSVPISRATYNGFLDTMGLPGGSIDNNLWDIRHFIPNISSSATFINGQLHGHLETGQIAFEQSFVGMTARVPVDFTNRTAHIHGEVDLHGNFATWFTVNLTPYPLDPNQMVDTDDRGGGVGRTEPILTLFDGQPGQNGTPGDVKLFEALGNGTPDFAVGPAHMVPDFSYNNVRNTIDEYVSTTHVKVVIDGQTLADFNLPQALPFSVGYLNLSAESYPKVDQNVYGVTQPCDQVGGACNTWHLDNWGFDAPSASSVQPATTGDFSQGCAPAPSQIGVLVTDAACSEQNVNLSSVATYHIPVADPTQTQSVQLLAQQYGFDTAAMQHAQVSVNGSAWLPLVFPETMAAPYSGEGMAQIPTSEISQGDNVVQVRTTAVGGSFPGMQIANVELQQVRTFAFTPPALPTEPAPIGTWAGGGGSPTPTPTATPTQPPSPTPTPAPIPINGVPCTVTLPAGQQTGTCSGTFTP